MLDLLMKVRVLVNGTDNEILASHTCMEIGAVFSKNAEHLKLATCVLCSR